MKKKRVKYTWEPPIVQDGDYVRYLRHGGQERTGWVRSVETRYDSNGQARHSYGIQQRLGGPWQYVGNSRILETLEEAIRE